MTTDTNQSSYELEQQLLNDSSFQHILKFAPTSQRELMTFELARYFYSLIRTEKLKLLAEVRERVVGSDEREVLVPAKPRQGLPTKDGIAVMHNKLRAEQRIALAKMEAEL